MISSSFTITKIDDINLKKYNITLKQFKEKIKKLTNLILNNKKLKTSKIFNCNANKIKFDISFCNDKTIQEINRDYRQKDKPTDVITFSLFCDDENALLYRKTAELGQIIVSLETANTQKVDTLEKEILTLICHGILHLFGFDHLTQKDYLFIVDIQNEIVGKLLANE